jgi:hypothetical protein
LLSNLSPKQQHPRERGDGARSHGPQQRSQPPGRPP